MKLNLYSGCMNLCLLFWSSVVFLCLVCGFYIDVERKMKVLVIQLSLTLCDPMDSTPGSSVHGILQARILKWAAVSSSRGSPQPRGQTKVLPHCRQILYRMSHQGSYFWFGDFCREFGSKMKQSWRLQWVPCPAAGGLAGECLYLGVLVDPKPIEPATGKRQISRAFALYQRQDILSPFRRERQLAALVVSGHFLTLPEQLNWYFSCAWRMSENSIVF